MLQLGAHRVDVFPRSGFLDDDVLRVHLDDASVPLADDPVDRAALAENLRRDLVQRDFLRDQFFVRVILDLNHVDDVAKLFDELVDRLAGREGRDDEHADTPDRRFGHFQAFVVDFPPQIEGRDAVEHSDLVFGEGNDDIFLGHSRFVFSPCK